MLFLADRMSLGQPESKPGFLLPRTFLGGRIVAKKKAVKKAAKKVAKKATKKKAAKKVAKKATKKKAAKKVAKKATKKVSG